jgi:hypothetical protein
MREAPQDPFAGARTNVVPPGMSIAERRPALEALLRAEAEVQVLKNEAEEQPARAPRPLGDAEAPTAGGE